MSKEKNSKKKISKTSTSKYPELNDFELEIVCGGGGGRCESKTSCG